MEQEFLTKEDFAYCIPMTDEYGFEIADELLSVIKAVDIEQQQRNGIDDPNTSVMCERFARHLAAYFLRPECRKNIEHLQDRLNEVTRM